MAAQRGQHTSVLQAEAVAALNIKPSGIYIDATYGRGGHSSSILEKLNSNGRLISIDQDPEAIADGQQRFANEPRLSLYKQNFEALDAVAMRAGVLGLVDGVLFDLGVSSPQLDSAERGFSFSKDGVLDMRMDTEQGETAANWLQHVDEKELARVLRDYGDERYANRIAAAIIKARKIGAMNSTAALAETVKQAHPRWDHRRHPATKTFQAIRIHINRELLALEAALSHSVNVLKVHGRLVVISFHSIEDRIVKRFMRAPVPSRDLPRRLPQSVQSQEQNSHRLKALGKKRPSQLEIEQNPRARSAVLRIAERVS